METEITNLTCLEEKIPLKKCIRLWDLSEVSGWDLISLVTVWETPSRTWCSSLTLTKDCIPQTMEATMYARPMFLLQLWEKMAKWNNNHIFRIQQAKTKTDKPSLKSNRPIKIMMVWKELLRKECWMIKAKKLLRKKEVINLKNLPITTTTWMKKNLIDLIRIGMESIDKLSF